MFEWQSAKTLTGRTGGVSVLLWWQPVRSSYVLNMSECCSCLYLSSGLWKKPMFFHDPWGSDYGCPGKQYAYLHVAPIVTSLSLPQGIKGSVFRLGSHKLFQTYSCDIIFVTCFKKDMVHGLWEARLLMMCDLPCGKKNHVDPFPHMCRSNEILVLGSTSTLWPPRR